WRGTTGRFHERNHGRREHSGNSGYRTDARGESLRRFSTCTDDLHVVDWSARDLSDEEGIPFRRFSCDASFALANCFYGSLLRWYSGVDDYDFFHHFATPAKHAEYAISNSHLHRDADFLAVHNVRLGHYSDSRNHVLPESDARRMGRVSCDRPLGAQNRGRVKWRNGHNRLC